MVGYKQKLAVRCNGRRNRFALHGNRRRFFPGRQVYYRDVVIETVAHIEPFTIRIDYRGNRSMAGRYGVTDPAGLQVNNVNPSIGSSGGDI
jgi:hypothetical protein